MSNRELSEEGYVVALIYAVGAVFFAVFAVLDFPKYGFSSPAVFFCAFFILAAVVVIKFERSL